MKKQLSLAIALAMGLTSVTSASAATPVCTAQQIGNDLQLVVENTGVVFPSANVVPQGLTYHAATGAKDGGKVTVSFHETEANRQFGQSVKLVARIADAPKYGWISDRDVVAGNPKVITCTYGADRTAQICRVSVTPEMITVRGGVRTHFAAIVGGNVYPTYQGQAGNCTATASTTTGDPHAEVAVKQ